MKHANESHRLNLPNRPPQPAKAATSCKVVTSRCPRLSAPRTLAAWSALLLCTSAAAFDNDVVNVQIDLRERYDSNLFRLPDGVQPYGNQRRSATIRTTGVGLQVDKTYGLQRFDVSATVTHDHYSPYESLDATGRAYNAAWGWTFTPSITGNLSMSRSESLNNFADNLLPGQAQGQIQTQPNRRRTEERRFDVNWRPGAALHPRVSLLQNEDKSDQTTIDRQNSKTTSLESALVYEFRSGNTAELYFRRGRGNYLDINADPTFEADSQFNENETGLSAHYRSTGASSFDGRIGYLDRRHRTFSSRNFSGPVGYLYYTYTATGKTQIQLSASRSLASTQSFITSYSRDETLAITPSYSATGKITIRPSFSFTRRNFFGSLVPVADELRMTMRDATFQVDYAALRALNLSFAVTKSNRTSNDGTFQFSNRSASVQASLRF